MTAFMDRPHLFLPAAMPSFDYFIAARAALPFPEFVR